MPAGAFATGKLTPQDYGKQIQEHHDNFVEGFGHAAWDGISGIGEGLWNHVTSQLADTYDHITGRDRATASQIQSYKQAGGKIIDAGSPSHVFLNTQLGVAHQAFEIMNPDNMYRLAMLNYHKYGWGGVVGSLAPMVVGGVAGALTGGVGGAAVAGEIATEAGATGAAEAATAAGAESATVAGETAGAATDATAGVGQTVAQRLYMARYAAAKDAVMNSPVGTVAKIVGLPFKAAYKLGSSPILAGAQLPYTSLYLADGNIGDMWKQAQDPNVLNKLNLPNNIGAGFSDLLTGNKNTWLAGTVNAITGLISTPFMVGRALKYSTKGVEGLRAVDSVAVDLAYHNNRGYRNALDQIIKIGEGKFGPAAEDGIAGAIARTMPSLSPIAKDLAEVVAKEGATGYDLSRRIGELADLNKYVHGVNLPTMGIYGMLKMYGKLSDGAIPTYFSRVLGQSSMAVSELNKTIETGTIELGDSQGAYKLGQLLQQTGMASRDITRIVNHLVTTQDLGKWENVVKSALKENFYQRIDRLLWKELGLDSERLRIAFRQGKLADGDLKFLNDKLNDVGLRDFYTTIRQTVSDRVDKMVGSSSAGKVGLFGTNAVGDDISRIGEDGSRSAAITENQAGKLHLPDYKKFDKEFAEMFKKYRKVASGDVAFTEMMGSGMSRTAEVLDSWVNDRFFKPMALLTPGWALRVSLSELILNTARLGPANMAAAGITASAAATERRAAKRAIYWSGKMTDHLSSRAVALRQHIDDLKAELEDRGINASTNQLEIEQMQRELDALNQHIRWLKSPAGTPAPGSVGEQATGDMGGVAPMGYHPDPSMPGFGRTTQDEYDRLAEGTADRDARRARNIENRNKPQSERDRGGQQVLNRLQDEVDKGVKNGVIPQEHAEYVRKFVNDFIGGGEPNSSLFFSGVDGGVRLKSVLRTQDFGSLGDFNFGNNLIRLYGSALKAGKVDQTTVHELWHYLSQYVDASEVKNLTREMTNARDKFLLKNSPVEFAKKRIPDLDKAIETLPFDDARLPALRAERKWWKEFLGDGLGKARNISGDNHGIWSEIPMSYLGNDGYRLRNVDEWFAESMRDMYAGQVARGPLMQFAKHIMDLIWAGIHRFSGYGAGRSIYRDFRAGRYMPGDFQQGSLAYRANLSSGARDQVTKMQQDLFAGNEPLIAPDRERLISDFLGSKGYKVNATQAQNLSMIMRGVLAGTKLTTLNAIGKDQFIKYGAYLIERHGGYMPHAVDSVHKSIFNNIDWNAEYESVTKTKTIKDKTTGLEVEVPKTKKIIGRGEIKTKMVLMSPDDFSTAAFGQKRYFEGWFYGANTLAQSELARPLAAAYLRLYRDAGLRGEDLHNAAVTEAERILANAPDRIKDIMARSQTASVIHDQEDPMGSWASTLVDRLEGIAAPARERVLTASERRAGVRAAIGESTVHTSLLEDIANNMLPEHVNEFYHQYAFDASGNQLPKEYFPSKVITRTPEIMGGSRLLEKLSSAGHAKVLGPMVNYMSRQPTYIAEFVQARQGFEEAVKRGSITADQADVLAETSAMKNMVKYIHNPSDKTKFEEMISWAAPFYFAQNQAMRRMGRLLAENPGAFMQYLYTLTQIQKMVNNAVDQNGMSIKTIPGLMLYGLNFTASLSSLSTMDPFFIPPDAGSGSTGSQSLLDILSPKFGPLVTVLTKMLYYTNPSLNDTAAGRFAARNLEGNIGAGESMPQFLFQSAIPNSVARNIVAGMTGAAFANTGFGGNALAAIDNSYVQAEIEALRYSVSSESEKYWNYLGTKEAAKKLNDGKPITGGYKAQLFYGWQASNWNINSKSGAHSMQNLLDTARQHTTLLWALKSVVGSLSPVSIGLSQSDQSAINMLQNYAKDPKYKGNYMKAVDAFTKDHPYAGVDTLAKSISTGGYYPETKSAFNWLNGHSELARQYPYAALALAPDMSKDTKYYQPAHTLMLNIGLRNRETPNDFINQFLIQQGNAFYYNWIKPTYEEKHKVDKSAAHKWRTDAINWYGANHNTTWLNSYQAGASATDKIYAIKQFMDMTSPINTSVVSQFTPEQAKTVTLLRQLRNAIMGNNNNGYYQQMTQAITSGKIDSVTAKDNWQSWLDGIIKKYPEMKQGIMTLYYNLG